MQKHIAFARHMPGVIRSVRDRLSRLPSDAESVAITLRCRSGKHRSVAVGELFKHELTAQGYRSVVLRHVSLEAHTYRQRPVWGCQCWGPPTTADHIEAQAEIARLWRE